MVRGAWLVLDLVGVFVFAMATPCVAGFFLNIKVPISLKLPLSVISAQAIAKRASMTPLTSLFVKEFVSAINAMTVVSVNMAQSESAWLLGE